MIIAQEMKIFPDGDDLEDGHEEDDQDGGDLVDDHKEVDESRQWSNIGL